MLVHAHLFFQPLSITITGDDGLLSYFLTKDISRLPNNLLLFGYLALLIIQALRLDFLMAELKMFNNDGYTTALSFVLLSGFFTQWFTLSSALIANSFIIWIFIQLTKLYNNPEPKSLLFNTGLIVGATVLLYQPTAILLIVVLFSVAIIRPFNISEYIVLLFGIIMPFYLIVSLLYLNDKMQLLPSFIPNLQLHVPQLHHPIVFWVGLSLAALLFLLGVNVWSVQNSRMLIQIRKNWSAMLVMAFVLLPIPFIFQNAGIESTIICIMPFAAFVSNIFLYPKKLLIPNILFWLCVAWIAYNNWFLYKK